MLVLFYKIKRVVKVSKIFSEILIKIVLNFEFFYI